MVGLGGSRTYSDLGVLVSARYGWLVSVGLVHIVIWGYS